MRKILIIWLLSWLCCGAALAQASQGISLDLYRSSNSNNTGSTDKFGSAAVHSYQAVLLETTAEVTINAVVTEVTVTQTFENQSNDWVEAVYSFPLPEKAAVDRMTMTLDDKRIVGKIRKKQLARQQYQAAVASGQQAALLESRRDNLFTAKAGHIAPHSRIAIELHYVQPTLFANGMFSLILPTTYTPRYRSQAAHAGGDNLPAAVFTTDSENPLRVNIKLNAGAMLTTLESPSHEIVSTIAADGQAATITTAAAQIAMDKDFRLHWRVLDSGQPLTLAFTEQTDSGYYTSLLFVPSLLAEPVTVPREIVLMIDTSGSMQGAAMREAKAGALAALDYLNPGDRFNLLAFNSDYQTLFTDSQPVTPDNLQAARDFIHALVADGGTEMFAPLSAALSAPNDGAFLRQIIFLTDGAVGNERQLFTLVKRTLGDSRLFTVGIGAAPNHFFMRQAARAGRGSFTTIADNNAVDEAMQQLFAQLQQPSLTDIELDLADAGIAEHYPNPIGDVYTGQPVVAHIKSDLPPMNIGVNALLGGASWQVMLPPLLALEAPKITADSALAKLWAREKVHALTEEADFYGTPAMNDAAIERLGLDYQLLTAQTAFLAVAQNISRDPVLSPLRRQTVANQLPAGSEMGFPMTSNNSALYILCALLLLGLAMLLRYFEYRSQACHG